MNKNDLTVWELPQDAIARYGHGYLLDLAVSADGMSLAVGSAVGVWWYDLTTRHPVTFFETERGMIDYVSLCIDQPWLVLKNSDKNGNEVIKIWDMQRHQCISVMEYPARFREYPSQVFLGNPCFSPSGKWLAASHNGNVAAMHNGSVIVDVWESLTGKVRTSLELPAEDIELCSIDGWPDNGFFWDFNGALAFSPDDQCVASSHWSDFISVWDITHGERIIRLTGHLEGVHSLSFSPCGQFLAAGGIKGTVQVWETSTWQLHRTYHPFSDDWMDISYAPDGSLRSASISHGQCTITVWDVAQQKDVYTFHEKNYCDAEIYPIHFSNGRHLAFRSDFEVCVKTVEKIKPIARLPWELGDLHSLTFSPDRKTLAAGYRQFGGVVLWDVATHRPQHVVTEPRCHIVAVYSDTGTGKFYATGFPPGESLYYGNTLNLWEIGQSEPIAEITIPGGLPDRRHGMTYAPATNLLACGNGTEKDDECWDENDPENGAVYVWDVTRGQMRHIFRGKHTNRIDYMRFSPDGTRLLSIDVDNTKRVWDVILGEEIDEFEDFKELTHLFPIFYNPPLTEVDGEYPYIEQRENSPCGQYVAVGESWKSGLEKVPVRLWGIHTGENIATFLGHPTDIQCLAFSPDSTILASGGFDGVIYLWDLKPYLNT